MCCMSQLHHYLVLVLLKLETIITASTMMGFPKVHTSVSDQLDGLLV